MITLLTSSRQHETARQTGWTFALVEALAIAAQGQPPDLGGKGSPVQTAPREHAAYVRPDGTIQIVTCSQLAGVVRALNEVFTATHPGVEVCGPEGDNYSAMATLTFDRSALGSARGSGGTRESVS